MNPLEPYWEMLRNLQPVGVAGRVSAVRGLTVSVADFPAPVGAGCRIIRGQRRLDARVIGFTGRETLIMPMGAVTGIARGDRVICSSHEQTVPVSPGMLGRVLNGLGRPIDDGADIRVDARMPIWPEPAGALHRRRITEPLPTGVRAIDALLTVGRGQRMGIFSGSGVGKSVLLGMIARYTTADVIVIALVGERTREALDFIAKDLGPEGRKRAVVVVSTGEEPPLVRVHSGAVATAIAEYFRNRGANVLLLMDSLTRLAMAQRQIGLAAGEPPATKGYTPSVFNLLPQLLERCGRTDEGSITGFYTVLLEADDLAEPVSDAARAVADGHIFLDRDLANSGHFPAIDVLQSVSRVMPDVTDQAHRDAAREVQATLAAYREVEDMLSVGAYQAGANGRFDLAIRIMPVLRRFLTQRVEEPADFDRTAKTLIDLHRRIQAAREQLGQASAPGRPGSAGPPGAAGPAAAPGRAGLGEPGRADQAWR